MNEEPKSEGLIKDSYELIIKEFQTLISIFYLALVSIGMIFNYYKYDQFGINIFQYADAFDFLIAPFQDILIIVFALLSTILPYGALRIDNYFKNHKPETYTKSYFGLDKKTWFKPVRILFIFALFIAYLDTAGSKYGEYYKDHIQEQPTLSIQMQNSAVEKGTLIGKTKDIIFLQAGKKVTAIPINSSVLKIEIE